MIRNISPQLNINAGELQIWFNSFIRQPWMSVYLLIILASQLWFPAWITLHKWRGFFPLDEKCSIVCYILSLYRSFIVLKNRNDQTSELGMLKRQETFLVGPLLWSRRRPWSDDGHTINPSQIETIQHGLDPRHSLHLPWPSSCPQIRRMSRSGGNQCHCSSTIS